MKTNSVQSHRSVVRSLTRLASAALLAGVLMVASHGPAATALAPRGQTVDPGPSVLFDSIAQEEAWASIRYNPQAGLALIFSDLYPVK